MSTSSEANSSFDHLLEQAPKSKPKRVISPRLRVMLVVVLALFSLLFANGIYLSAITWLQHFSGKIYEDFFYQLMFLLHLGLGLLLILPVIIFGTFHMLAARKRRNRRAVKIGYALFGIAILLLVSGVLLTRQFGIELRSPSARSIAYWAHVISPLVAIWLYWLHRLVGPKIKWYVARRIGIATASLIGIALIFQTQDPRSWSSTAPAEGDQYFEPSLARTASGNFIPARALQNDEYCMRCHEDIYDNWFHSSHHFSSFNNPAYLYSVRETRQKVMERDGSIKASRWCAGCHDPVPFFSGAFDDPNYDDVKDPTSQAGITCTVCHAISHVNSTKGNADYVIEEPVQYPFTYSDSPILQKVNELLVKAKPGFHKKTFLKPIHKSAEFCSTCHKVHLPKELTAYKDFLRGQNHYDSYLLSGVSGHGASSFYYPEEAQTNCNECHMPQVKSDSFGAKYSEKLGSLAVHDHFFPGANTALPWWRGADGSGETVVKGRYSDIPALQEDWVEHARDLLKDVTRVDIFGLRKDGTIDGELIAPINTTAPLLSAGEDYLLETVIRTTKLGHHLTQGTVDSNQLWLEVMVKSDGELIGKSGLQDEVGKVDPWAHFVNVFVLDREGNKIATRNAEDIFVPLYNHQIPPGAGQTVHYGLSIPDNITSPVEVTVKLQYRKFDHRYIEFMNEKFKEGDHEFRGRSSVAETRNDLPITTMAEDRVVFGVVTKAGEKVLAPTDNNRKTPVEWQRWNDYGIGMLLSGKSQLKQAADAFGEVARLGRFDGPLNLARVQFAEGDLNGATESLAKAASMEPAPPAWTMAWLSGEVSRQQGLLQQAVDSFRSVLEDDTAERRRRKFDFSKDIRVRNSLGLTLIDLAEQAEFRKQSERQKLLLDQAKTEFLKVLEVDSEDVTAHASLAALYQQLGDQKQADYHSGLQLKYKMDDNARDLAVPKARRRYPAADHAAEPLTIYSLHR